MDEASPERWPQVAGNDGVRPVKNRLAVSDARNIVVGDFEPTRLDTQSDHHNRDLEQSIEGVAREIGHRSIPTLSNLRQVEVTFRRQSHSQPHVFIPSFAFSKSIRTFAGERA